ncbi:AraC family transcriptional regulator [Amphiplicatus metriothermophilus]|uniref:Transcriptional regulator, AraC family n=1 Tax=Amphiplicatus metriothermophilus TaxID=1519374 RepID=A0A239PP77_9PROT|nr:AraC family transcriptional regulator [Amphiplicatus metriothermophilus]MBB5518739.1 AraC-like DNA-binding protein [Amphiplicatus metriothermophilus]SNT72104.1 transcriptional regulator, AraC family [Amphiplicatus metriothermophilus]
MDVLSDILNIVKLQGSLYFRTEFSPPWGVCVPDYASVARFHLVTRGQCWVRVAGAGDAVRLAAGDLIVIPHGREHRLSDEPDRPAMLVDEVVQRAGFKGAGALVYGGPDRASPACLVCGHFAFDPNAGRLLLGALPPYIHVKGFQSLNYGWIDEAMKFITHEVHERAPGADAIINRLSEILFIQTMRHHARQTDVGLLAGLRDPQLARALSAIHQAPDRDWTVEALASEAGMSRTVFSERMRERIGCSPIQYLTQWRMELASRMLTRRDANLARIAPAVGYQSVGAFIRAFKKHFGVGPGRYQKTAVAAEAA